MTVAALSEGRAQISGNGTTDRIDLPFQFVDERNLQVVHMDAQGGRTVWEFQQEPGNWWFTGGDFSSGSVHFDASALNAGETLTVLLVSDFDQPYSLAGGEIDPVVMERAMDRTAINMQSVATRALVEKNGGFDLDGRRIINGGEAVGNDDVPTFKQVLEIASLPGAQGPKGPTGDQGAIGPTGAEGPEGPQGPQGERGPIGYQGPMGPVGVQGPEGPRGPEGPAGPTGGQGPIGVQGPQGPEGPIGKSFDPDASGLTADRNAYDAEPANFSFLDVETGTVYFKLSNELGTWSTGVPFGRGPTGLQGPQGIQGPAGPVGMSHRGTWSGLETYEVRDTVFYDGSYFICVAQNANVTPADTSAEWDLVASKGERGLQGQQGIQGADGPQGIQGPEGIQGIQGETGAQGPTGAQGAQGPQGDPGLAYRGAWSSGTTYNSDDTVTYNGSSYISLTINVGKNPSTETAHWGLLAAKGATGPQGPQGVGLSGNISANTEWQDNYEVRLGNGADLRIRHDGTNSVIDNYAGHLYIRTLAHSNTNGLYIQDEDSAGTLHNCGIFEHDRVLLYYDNNVRVQTTSAGVTVSGDVTATDRMYVGANGGGDSFTEYYDDNSNTWRYFG
ncbi:MAG: hypothetical protein JJ866_16760 [Roseibium sp.]|uniref:hypothetical protein n=1 Tax=Roseibium sp. TaxID=1936156 RepID=UPI001B0CC92D|nr:hypothetical protein [Roseibium sp.]MBO6893595.1 hypothetical protein [Roseibium sp.]MBO6930251.1 hypothetical protein [Roseibium sp.]